MSYSCGVHDPILQTCNFRYSDEQYLQVVAFKLLLFGSYMYVDGSFLLICSVRLFLLSGFNKGKVHAWFIALVSMI